MITMTAIAMNIAGAAFGILAVLFLVEDDRFPGLYIGGFACAMVSAVLFIAAHYVASTMRGRE